MAGWPLLSTNKCAAGLIKGPCHCLWLNDFRMISYCGNMAAWPHELQWLLGHTATRWTRLKVLCATSNRTRMNRLMFANPSTTLDSSTNWQYHPLLDILKLQQHACFVKLLSALANENLNRGTLQSRQSQAIRNVGHSTIAHIYK